MNTRYDSEKQRVIFLEVPLIKKDYTTLSEFFGNDLRNVLLEDKLENTMNKGAIAFKNKRVYAVNFRDIDFNKNKLDYLFQNLDGLEDVCLNDCKLGELPDGIYHLSKLKNLYLVNNNLKEISPEIKNLRNLEYLDLCHNYGLILPEEILELKKLQIVHLQGTRINSWDKIVENLKKKDVIAFS